MVNEQAPPRTLKGWLPMTLGGLALVAGTVWALQGINVLTDGQMSDDPKWAVIGTVVALAGLLSIIIGVRTRSRSKRPQSLADSDQSAAPTERTNDTGAL